MNANDIFPITGSMLTRQLTRGKTFRFAGTGKQYVYFLQKGLLKISYVNEEGKEAISHILKAGSLFGEKALLELAESREEYAMALENSVIAFIDTETIKDKMRKDPLIHSYLLNSIGNRMKKLEDKMLSMMFKEVRERIYDALMEVAIDFGIQEGDGLRVKNFLTHEDLAKLVSSSRQTVSSVMSEWKQKGIIDYNSRMLKIFIKHTQPAVA